MAGWAQNRGDAARSSYRRFRSRRICPLIGTALPVCLQPVKLFLAGPLIALATLQAQNPLPSWSDTGIERRAVEAIIWGMPVVNFDLMYQAMVRDAKAGPGSSKIVYWSKLSDWKNQTLTPNPDAVYFMPFFDTKEVRPVVLEIPAADNSGSITGSVIEGKNCDWIAGKADSTT